MNKRMITVLIVTLALVSLGSAQDQSQTFKRMQRNRVDRLHTFDVAQPVTLDGKILKVENCDLGKGRYSQGVKLVLEAKGKEETVHLGPSAYISNQAWEFSAGQNVKINAYPGTGKSQGMLFAADVNQDGKTLILRDKDGLPQWSGNKGRRGGRGNGQGRGRNRSNR